MTEYTVVPVEDWHVDELIDKLREEDCKEILAFGVDPRKGLDTSIKASKEVWTAMADGRVLCVFGINGLSLLSDVACPWCVTTSELKQHKRALVIATKLALEYWLRDYEVLTNYIDVNYTDALNWLKWAGFEVVEPAFILGPQGQTFYKVEKRRE